MSSNEVVTVDQVIERFLKLGYRSDFQPIFNLGDGSEVDDPLTSRIIRESNADRCNFVVFLIAENERWRVEARTTESFFHWKVFDILSQAVEAADLLFEEPNSEITERIQNELAAVGLTAAGDLFDCVPHLYVRLIDNQSNTQRKARIIVLGKVYLITGWRTKPKPRYHFATKNPDEILSAIQSFFQESDN